MDKKICAICSTEIDNKAIQCHKCGKSVFKNDKSPSCSTFFSEKPENTQLKKEHRGFLKKIRSLFTVVPQKIASQQEDPVVYGSIFSIIRKSIRNNAGIIQCSICSASMRIDLSKIESEVRSNLARENTMAASGIKMVIVPDWKKGGVCRGCLSIFCGRCTQEAYRNKPWTREKLNQVLRRYVTRNSVSDIIYETSLLSSDASAVLCPKCGDDLIWGIDHITD